MTRAKDISKILTDADISGNIDVDGVTNLDVVDIDGAVDMASTLVIGSAGGNWNGANNGRNLTIHGASATTTGVGQISIQSTDAFGADLGGGISFGGEYSAGDNIDWATLFGRKENGTDDNTAGYMQFNTRVNSGNMTERMRIDSSGRVLMGSTSTVFDTDQVLHVSGTQGCNMRATVESVGGSVLNLQRSDTTEGDFLRLINSSNAETGQIKVNSSGTTVFENVSDYRLKDNIKDWTVDAIAKVKQIKIRTFDWKDQTAQTNGKDVIGVIAHELQEVYSYCVSGEKDGYGEDVDKDGNKKPMYQGVDYGKLTPLLTKALQEQQATIEALTARIVTLENA